MTDIQTGFRPPANLSPGGKRGTAAIAALIMIVALTLGTLTAAAVVTVGLTRGPAGGTAHARAYAIELPVHAEERG
jgi:hypothetical protein